MVRPRDTDQQKLQKALAKIQSLTGKSISVPSVENLSEGKKEASRQAEAVADFFERPNRYIAKNCLTCGRGFLVNYPSVSRCSDQCRREYLAAIGIQWSPYKTAEERWAPSDVPLTIPPAALAVLAAALGREPQPTVPDQSSLPIFLLQYEQSRTQSKSS